MPPYINYTKRPFYITGEDPQKEEVFCTLELLEKRLIALKDEYDPMMDFLIRALYQIRNRTDPNEALKLKTKGKGEQKKGSRRKEINLAIQVAGFIENGKTVSEAIKIVSSDAAASDSTVRSAYYKLKKLIVTVSK